MYGTIARIKAKPTALDAIKKMETQRRPEGYLGTLVYHMDKNANEFWMVVLFENKRTYLANAESPTQDAEYREFRKMLEADPEWHDGEIVFNTLEISPIMENFRSRAE